MGYTIGLDFGTHQTKVCIEDNSNPQNTTYEFLLFKNPEGEEKLCLPSIVQINMDGTVSYGFCDNKPCKCIGQTPIKEPILEELPHLQLPPEPQKPAEFDKKTAFTEGTNLLPWQLKLLSIKQELSYKTSKEYKKWLEKRNDYLFKHNQWENDCKTKKDEYEKLVSEIKYRNKKKTDEYQKELEKSRTTEPLIFRYFKQALFEKKTLPENFDARIISIWYLAYVIFMLNEKYGEDFFIQMGVPCDSKSFSERKKLAKTLIRSAYYLVDEVFKNDLDMFLNAKYDELLSMTVIKEPSRDEDDNIAFVFPEAIASLKILFEYKKIVPGRMHLMVDIGGGTTDISFFSIGKENDSKNKTLVDVLSVYRFITIPYGLNYIDENCTVSSSLNISLIDKHYKSILDKEVGKLVKEIYDMFKPTGFPTETLSDALDKNTVLYCGGGSTIKQLCKPILRFQNVMNIDNTIFSAHDVNNVKMLSKNDYPILANAYGLAHTEYNDNLFDVNCYARNNNNLKLADFDKLFDHIIKRNKELNKVKTDSYEHSNDYGLADL